MQLALLGEDRRRRFSLPPGGNRFPARPSHLEEELQLLSLGLLQDLWLQVPEDGHARVDLVVGAHQHARREVVADLRPVQVVPEALGQPVEAHLQPGRKKKRITSVFLIGSDAGVNAHPFRILQPSIVRIAPIK